MLDEKGRLWLTSAVAAGRESGVLQGRLDASVGKAVPARSAAGRHLQVYDPETRKLTHIATCFGTHHLMFAEDANNTLWTSGGGQVVGWLNRKMFDETGDEEKSQGWTALIMDTNGNGKRDAYVEPDRACRSGEGQALRRGVLFGCARARWRDLGHGARLSRTGRAARARIESARDGTRRSLRAAVQLTRFGRASRRAAATSIATACSGPRSPAGTSRASIAASARARSTARRPPGSTARRAGRSTRNRRRSSGASRTAAASRAATTRGSISSTRSASARTCRSTPATRRKDCSR